jgi:hypothetical protein
VPTPLREVLLCPVSKGEFHTALIVLRHGRRCRLLKSIRGQPALLATSELGLAVLETTLGLPVRVLDPELAGLLAAATLISKQAGTQGYDLGDPFPHQLAQLL